MYVNVFTGVDMSVYIMYTCNMHTLDFETPWTPGALNC